MDSRRALCFPSANPARVPPAERDTLVGSAVMACQSPFCGSSQIIANSLNSSQWGIICPGSSSRDAQAAHAFREAPYVRPVDTINLRYEA
jgi:hypothetical protein